MIEIPFRKKRDFFCHCEEQSLPLQFFLKQEILCIFRRAGPLSIAIFFGARFARAQKRISITIGAKSSGGTSFTEIQTLLHKSSKP